MDQPPMASVIEAYLQARFDYEQVKKNIDLLADDIVLVGSALKRDPARFSFSDTGVDLPKDAFNGQAYPAADWATPVTIQELLKQLHETRLMLRRTWSSIPVHLKAGLQPPSTGVLPPQKFDKSDEK